MYAQREVRKNGVLFAVHLTAFKTHINTLLLLLYIHVYFIVSRELLPLLFSRCMFACAVIIKQQS